MCSGMSMSRLTFGARWSASTLHGPRHAQRLSARLCRRRNVGSDGLISRMDYSAAVTGGVPIAHYSSDYRDFDGIKIATRRCAYRRNPDGTALVNFIAVAIDIADIRLS